MAAAFLSMWPLTADAAPRDDLKAAYTSAIAKFNEMDYEAAQAGLEAAINAAVTAGLSEDPFMGPLQVLYGGVLYTNSGDRERTMGVFQNATRVNYYVQLPVELRSAELQALLEQARSAAGQAPAGQVAHVTPVRQPGVDVVFDAILGVPNSEGGQVALYWRRQGEAEYRAVSMDLLGNVATATITAGELGEGDVEYFLFAFDPASKPLAGNGEQTRPLVLRGFQASTQPQDEAPKLVKSKKDAEEDDESPSKKKKRDTRLPRGFIKLGVGTGFGLAHAGNTVEQTYRQYTPGAGTYGPAEIACAVARWKAGSGDLPTAEEFGRVSDPMSNTRPGTIENVNAIMMATTGAPIGVDPAMLAAAYDPSACAERHPVAGGMASAPVHLAPEIGFRVAKRVTISVYGRLQVYTGAKVMRDDPEKNTVDAFREDVYSPNPAGVGSKHPFTWAVGAKARYYFLKDKNKFRLFTGGFAGGGYSRLRIDMGFGDDKNGNSVPDNLENGYTRGAGGGCQAMWPYQRVCEGNAEAAMQRFIAGQVKANAGEAHRIDTVRLGSVFAGALFGFHYQAAKHFALYGEVAVGGWFPKQTSLLIDVNVGPAITW